MASDVSNPLLDDEDEEFSLPSLNDDLFLDKALPVVVNEAATIPASEDDEPLPSFDLPSPVGASVAPQEVSAPVQEVVAPVAEDEPSEPPEAVSEAPAVQPEDSTVAAEPLGQSPSFQTTFTNVNDLSAVFDVDDDDDDDDDSVGDLEEYYNQFGDDEEEEEDALGGFDIDAVLSEAIDVGASDVDVMADQPVEFTIMGDQERQRQFPVPTEEHMARIQQDLVTHVLNETFVLDMELDASYVIRKGPHKGRRLRLSVGRSFGSVFLCFRVISDRIPTLEDLKVSGELASWARLPKGLVLMNGATGTGKSTTLASMVQEVQRSRKQKIITIEKPVEYVYDNKAGKALVVQREVGRDARSFAKALESAMRQHPNIILVGEVRNKIEVDALLYAADSGHLAISTTHATSASASVNRIKGFYEGDDLKRVLSSMGELSRGLASQALLKTIDGTSRFAVREVLSVDDEVADLISAGDVKGIQKYQDERGITMEHELVKAVRLGLADREEARSKTDRPYRFDKIFDSSFAR